MATSAAADGEEGLRWADWWPCFTLTKPSSPLRSPPHGWCRVIDGLGFDRVWSPRKLTSARTLSSSSILRRDRQNGTKKSRSGRVCILYPVAHHALPGLLRWVIFSLNGAPVLSFPLHHPVVFSPRPSCTNTVAPNTLWILFFILKDTLFWVFIYLFISNADNGNIIWAAQPTSLVSIQFFTEGLDRGRWRIRTRSYQPHYQPTLSIRAKEPHQKCRVCRKTPVRIQKLQFVTAGLFGYHVSGDYSGGIFCFQYGWKIVIR